MIHRWSIYCRIKTEKITSNSHLNNCYSIINYIQDPILKSILFWQFLLTEYYKLENKKQKLDVTCYHLMWVDWHPLLCNSSLLHTVFSLDSKQGVDVTFSFQAQHCSDTCEWRTEERFPHCWAMFIFSLHLSLYQNKDLLLFLG